MAYLLSVLLLLSIIAPSLWARPQITPIRTQSDLELVQLREEQFRRQIEDGLDGFFEPGVDYSVFTGRVTDRDQTSNILKISSENRNIRFFRAGDEVTFRLASEQRSRPCEGNVRSIEEGHFVIFVRDLNRCFNPEAYFRRGTMLVLQSERLANRLYEASKYRVLLISRRRDYFEQLNRINHFIWSYDQERVKVAADYDRRILELQQAKDRAMTGLTKTKQDNLRLQRELMVQLDELDRDLDFYRISRDELHVDRWHLDHDAGLPVGRRPQAPVEGANLRDIEDRRRLQQ
jgi:hypothetical protein